mgnify:CR=1 FL=1
MLNGAPPFDADSPIGLLHKHISEPAPQLVGARLNSDMPPELDLVIRKAMAKQPEDRYQSIADFAEHIALILDRREDHLPKDLYTLFKTKKQNNKPHTLTAFIGIALLLCILLVSPSILKQEKTKQSEIKIGKFDRKPRTSSLKKSAIKVDPSSIASLQNSIDEMSKNSKFVAAIQYVKDWIGTEKKQGRLTPSKEVYAVVQLSNLYAHNLEHAKGADLLKNTFISLDKNPSSTDQDRLSLLQQKMTMDTWWGDSNTQTENANKLITILNSTKSLSSLEKANGWFVVANAFDSGLKSKEALAALDKAKKANRFENKNYSNLEAVYEEFSAHIHYRLHQTEEAQNAIRRAFELKSSQKAILDSANPAALYEMQGDAAALGGWWQIAADMFALCLKDQNISRDKRASYLIKHASNLQSTWCCNSRNHGPHRDRFAERKEWLADQSLAAQEFETVARMSKDNLKQYREALVLKARCQIALEQFDEADKTIKRALKTGKQENDNDVRAFVANSLWCHGSGSQMNGFVPESVSLFQKSVEVYAGLSDYKHQEAQAKASLARALEEQKQWAKQHNLN